MLALSSQYMNKRISVIISNYNGEKWLQGCLDSLYIQTYKNFEIILVDNDSEDDSCELVKKNYPEVIVIQNKEDLGFSGGNNVGLKRAKGEYILLLSNDTVADKNYLRNFIKAFDEIPNLGVAQSKIVLMSNPDKLDSCGAFWTDSTFLYHYGVGKDQSLPRYNKSFPVFSVKGASMLIKKDLVDKIGLFDDDFWCYYEETDFCHRVWLAGYECWYYPKALIHHAVGGTTTTFFKSDYIQFHSNKNKIRSFLKNFELINLLYILPVFLSLLVFLSFIWLLQRKPGYFFSVYKSIFCNITHIGTTLAKRKKTQALRVRSDRELSTRIKKNPKLNYYYHLLSGLKNFKEDPIN